uniref:Extracellular globin n=1 Tax=Haemadipsa zeylanica TaxID=73399 RepID=Q75ZP7_9ANNE|nr:globin M1 precursor [Haemadipsa zeylanica]
MRSLVIVCALFFVASTQADPHQCGLLEKFKFYKQWTEVFGLGEQRIEFGLKVFAKLFHDHPDARKLFSNVNGENIYSHEFKAHVKRVLSSLDLNAILLSRNDLLEDQLAHLKGQHDSRGVDWSYVQAFKQAMLEVLPEYLGVFVCYESWDGCLEHILTGIFKGH